MENLSTEKPSVSRSKRPEQHTDPIPESPDVEVSRETALNILLFEDEAVVNKLLKSKDKAFVDSRDDVMERLHATVEQAKPTLRRGFNKIRNTNLGTIAEVGLGVFFLSVTGYVASKGVKKKYKKRKDKKAGINEDDVLSDS